MEAFQEAQIIIIGFQRHVKRSHKYFVLSEQFSPKLCDSFALNVGPHKTQQTTQKTDREIVNEKLDRFSFRLSLTHFFHMGVMTEKVLSCGLCSWIIPKNIFKKQYITNSYCVVNFYFPGRYYVS